MRGVHGATYKPAFAPEPPRRPVSQAARCSGNMTHHHSSVLATGAEVLSRCMSNRFDAYSETGPSRHLAALMHG